VGLALLALAAAAVIPGSHTGGAYSYGVTRVAARSRVADPLRIRETKVFGSSLSAKSYGTQVAEQEDQGINASGQLTSDLSPIPARAFAAPIAAYRAYAERWASKLAGEVPALATDLRGGRRPAAERTWNAAFADYLHLGAVYGLLPASLDQRLAGLPQTLGDRRFGGLHRIEMGLWTGEPPRSLVPVATALMGAASALRRVLPTVTISPLDYATRAHEILEDAQRDLMSGTEVPWSGAGVLGTEAGVVATKEVISTLAPILDGRDNTLVEVQSWLSQLQGALRSVQRRDGSWPALGQLSSTQRERLDGNLAGALGALEQVPGALETAPVPAIPQLPAGASGAR
jgi:high-affinity iron transporter